MTAVAEVAPVTAATVLATLLPGFAGPELPAWMRSRLADGVAGVCLYGDNVVDRAQVVDLARSIRAAAPDALIAVDEEGGDVTRLDYAAGSMTPGNAVLGRIDDEAVTHDWARAIGDDLAAAGIDLDLAPTVDVNADPRNPVIGVRSFGADPELVARHTAAWVRGLQGAGVAASLKHFPGHGDTAVDSHLGLPVVTASAEVLRDRDLRPFVAGIAAGARAVMTSHIVVPALDPDGPATFSHRILTDLLRGELGFDGVIVTDALDMAGASATIGIPEAAVRALAAGADLLCVGPGTTPALLDAVVSAVLDAVAAGRLSGVRVADAAARVHALRTVHDSARAGRHAVAEAPRTACQPDRAESRTVLGAFADRSGGAAVAQPVHWVRLATDASIAVGEVPWGPFAAGARAELTLADASPSSRRALARLVERSGTTVLVGRANHLHPWIAELAAPVRDRVLIVDMGWPDADVDLATYGASRLVGAVLCERLEGAR